MDTNILFKIDKKTKERAAKKAKKQGLTLSSFLRSATRAYADGDIEVGIELNPKVLKDIREAQAEVRAGKTISQEELFEKLGI